LLYLAAGTAIQLLLPANVVATSPAPFADAIMTHWGRAAASLAAVAIIVSALGCLNCLVLGTGELGYAMALRGDLPTVMARTRGVNTPVVAQVVGSALTILAILANSNRTTANLYTFIILLSTAGVIVVYFVGSLAAWKLTTKPRERFAVAFALLFALYALYGTGLEPDLWCIVLLAAGLVVRSISRWRAGSSRAAEAHPAAPPESAS